MNKVLALLLAAFMLLDICMMPVCASEVHSEDPLAVKDLKEFGAALTETTIPGETHDSAYLSQMEPTVPKTVEQEKAVQEPTEAAEETVVAETVPVETDEKKPIAEEVSVDQPVGEQEESEAVESAEEPEDPDAPRGHNGVPLYFQNDYPNNIYGMGTIETNGCSAASLAMVATYLTGHEYLPDEIARYFGGAAENNIARLEHGSKMMQLPFKEAENWPEALAAIRNGKIVIVLVDSGSVFTQSQHFIVVTGVNEDGKLMVNDSWKPNYEKWDCKEGLKNGFDPNAILAGWSGAWIYDKDAMPEEPFLYSEPAPERGEPRYGIELTWEQMQLIAKVVWVESRGESKQGQQAVAEVILNRLVSDKFPDTLNDVIYAENQFRSAKFLKDAQPYQQQYEAIENALYGPYVLPEDVYYFATTAKTERVWGQIGGHIFCYADN